MLSWGFRAGRWIRWCGGPGSHVFGVDLDLDRAATGSGDGAANWVTVACLLFLAAVVTVVWSVVDRRRRAYLPSRGFHWVREALYNR
ncbi:hypothetical protein BJY24_000366 [Nocardia transvalensis]|uniref:Uncharacterized protein n=1 Tax=Nocardia transvalensis TaxID=37333 RepID=A0A7W9P8L3_9NOCA|nr:hypothetical protein [Nocardia transvalensis]MBB5911499.1 hypothetical protein [Nocardia transvalensis]